MSHADFQGFCLCSLFCKLNKLSVPPFLLTSYICSALLVALMSVGLWISPRISRAHISWAFRRKTEDALAFFPPTAAHHPQCTSSHSGAQRLLIKIICTLLQARCRAVFLFSSSSVRSALARWRRMAGQHRDNYSFFYCGKYTGRRRTKETLHGCYRSVNNTGQSRDLPTVPLCPLSAATIRAERPLLSTVLISAPWRSTSWSPATSSAKAAACSGVLRAQGDISNPHYCRICAFVTHFSMSKKRAFR